MHIKHYLDRIGFKGPVAPTLECLNKLHRCHAFTIPYENLDVQLQRPLDFDLERIYDKIVLRRRGGWCYEVHTLFHWVLSEIGFDVSLVSAGVERRELGDGQLGNHVAVLVRLDQIYLADLGLGDGLREPIPLQEGAYRQGKLEFKLEKIEGDYWRFLNHGNGVPSSFDFKNEPLNLALVEAKNHDLQTSSESDFVKTLACQIMQLNSVTCLTGRVLREKTPEGVNKRLLQEDEFQGVLVDVFGLDDEEAITLWPKIDKRHREVFGDKTAEQIDYQGF